MCLRWEQDGQRLGFADHCGITANPSHAAATQDATCRQTRVWPHLLSGGIKGHRADTHVHIVPLPITGRTCATSDNFEKQLFIFISSSIASLVSAYSDIFLFETGDVAFKIPVRP